MLMSIAAPVTALPADLELQLPEVALVSIPLEVSVQHTRGSISEGEAAALRLVTAQGRLTGTLGDEGNVVFEVLFPSTGEWEVALEQDGESLATGHIVAIPAWTSVLPPLLAIFLALAFRSVIPALFVGIWVGAWAIEGFSLPGLWLGLLDTVDVYVHDAVADADHAAIMVFTFMVGGMVGLVSRNGGMQGIVNRIVTWANTPRRGQLATWGLGLLIFFDDYANTLVVGNTARPLSDRLLISREKLAYIVDSTAAPVATVALVTTWIGYQVGLIGDGVSKIDGVQEGSYSIFLNSIPYSFYPLLSILFVFAVAHYGRDFGPMYVAEERARTTGALLHPDAEVDHGAAAGAELQPDEAIPKRGFNAVLPLLVLVGGVLAGLWVTGEGDSIQAIIGSADSYRSLMWASLLSVLTAAMLSITQRLLTLTETVDAWFAGVKFMLFAMIILVLAWSLSAVTGVLHTADYLVALLGETLPAQLLPAMVFGLAAMIAFATGTSWGVMAILMPLAIPLTWGILQAGTLDASAQMPVLYSVVSCVLAGAVWGDHCSPISDTTILSSLASGCDHMDHVRTQIPYALLVGGVGLLIGTIPTGFGLPWWLSYLFAVPLLFGALHAIGREVPDRSAQ